MVTVQWQLDEDSEWLSLASTTVDVAAQPVIGPGEEYCYPYPVTFPAMEGGYYRVLGEASATNGPGSRGPATTKESFTLPAAPDILVNDTVNVADTNGGEWEFTDTGSATYEETYTDAGTFTNTATIDETGQTAEATVTVTLIEICATEWDAVAYWCFDDQVSPTADGADGHDATIVGGGFDTVDLPPVPGNKAALSLDGSDDYAWTPHPDSAENLDGFGGLTIAAWINPSTPDGSQLIVSKYNNAPAVRSISWSLELRDGELRIHVTNPEGPGRRVRWRVW